jgi:hypothetical protein
MNDYNKYKKDLERLTKCSDLIYNDLIDMRSNKKVEKGEQKPGQLFFSSYQQWYTEARELIRQILPTRLNEFELLYQGDIKRKIIDATTYSIRDWLLGIRSTTDTYNNKKFDDDAVIFMRFQMQRELFVSSKIRFESSILELKQIVRADLFDSEIESSRELLKKGFIRAAGAVVGVIAEKHLAQLCENHSIALTNKNPTIGTYNDALKDNEVIDVPDWRFIQRLGDLRNLCDHNKEKDPTTENVTELIDGVDKLMKTIN